MATKPKSTPSKKMPAIAIMIVPKMKGKKDKEMMTMKKNMKDKC